MQTWGLTDQGCVRTQNQDAYHIVQLDKNTTLCVVCDGMGGHSMGDVAAEIVSNAICEYWNNNTDAKDSETKVREACQFASEALYVRSRVVRPIEMGTTMVMARWNSFTAYMQDIPSLMVPMQIPYGHISGSSAPRLVL